MAAPLFTFRSACIYASDAALVEPGEWLNDALLSFGLELLEALDDAPAPAPAPPAALALVQPCSAALHTLLEPDDFCDALRALRLSERAAVCFPVSDAGAQREHGDHGSHWSLLVWARRRRQFVHFDSVPASRNLAHARGLAAAIWPLLRGEDGAMRPPELQLGRCGAQNNSSDCGVHVLLAAELVREALLASPEGPGGLDVATLDLRPRTMPAAAAACRQRLRAALSDKAGHGKGDGVRTAL